MNAVRMAPFAAMLKLGPDDLMALLIAYFDESESVDAIIGMAGLVGTSEQWACLEEAWGPALESVGRRFLHMKDNPPSLDELAPFAKAVQDAGLFGVGHYVISRHLKEFNRDHNLNVSGFPIALYGCLLELADKFPDDDLAVWVDHCDKPNRRIDLALTYAETDGYYRRDRWPVIERMTVAPVLKRRNIDDFPSLQAADFLAWELRRHAYEKLDFLLYVKEGDDPDAWVKQELDWHLDKHGSWPRRRDSLNRLLKAEVESMVWDRRALEIAHRARGGSWGNSSRHARKVGVSQGRSS